MRKYFLVIQIILFIVNIICCVFIFSGFQKISMDNLSFYKVAKVINLENINNLDMEEITNKIEDFYLLKEVDFGSKAITKEEKNTLEEKYPKIKFKASLYVDIYDKLEREDAKYLDLSKAKIDDNLENYLLKFSSLEKVNLLNQEMSVDRQIKLVKDFPKIEFNFTINIDDKKYTSLDESLDLSYTQKSFSEINDLLTLFPKLKNLDLSYSWLSNEECNQFRTLYPDIETNWVVHLGRWSLRTDATAFSVLIKYFDYERMNSIDIDVLKYCTKLKALDLGHQAITDISVIGDYLKDLRILILADNKITDISPIGKLKKLHYLELFINPVSDISPLQNNKELVDLNLANLNKVTDISPILDLPKIERLWVNNMGIGWEGIKMLANAYPNAEMMTTGRQSTHGSWRSHPRYFQMIDMFYNNYYGDEFSKYD